MPDGVIIPGGPSFSGSPQPPDVPCDPTGEGWRGPPGPAGIPGPAGPAGADGTGAEKNIRSVLDYGAVGDGVADDTAAIQSVLNNYAGKSIVFVPDTGHPYMVRALTIPTGTDCLVHGTLKFAGAVNAGSMIYVQNVSNVTFRGHGTLDGNSAAQAVFYTNTATNVQLSGLTLQNAHYWNLNVVASHSVIVDSVQMFGGGDTNQFAAGSDDCWMTNCTIDGVIHDIAFGFYGGVTNSGAIGNTIRNTVAGDAINVLCDTSQPAGCSNILIADNIIHDNYGAGISIARGAGSSSFHSGITVSDNRCYNNRNPDYHVDYCIGSVFNGNQSTNCSTTTGTAYAFYAGPNATSTSFIGNQVSHIAPGTTTGVGLYINSANIVYASGNQFIDNQSPHVMTAAIGGSAGLRNAFIGNFCDMPVALTLQSDTVMANDIGGLWTINNQNYSTLPTNAANDAAAATAGVPVGGVYRAGSALQIRVT